MNRDPQIDSNGKLVHLLSIEGIPRDILIGILDTARSFVSVTEREIKKVPLLRGKSVFNLFFEPSTRTHTTFEIAAKRLSADVINLNVGSSSQSKGDTLSTPATEVMPIRHRRCSTYSPFAITRKSSPVCESLSSATYSIRALPAHRFMHSPRLACPRCA